MLIQLDDPKFIPQALRQKLDDEISVLQSEDFMETLTAQEPFRSIALQLEAFIRGNTIIGYHCTREPSSGFFLQNGLLALNREAHQAEFLATYGTDFSQAEIDAMRRAWTSYFSGHQDQGRNGLLWFCLTSYLVVNGGTECFFEYFGGEAIHMPLDDMPKVMEKLRRIGHPTVVEAAIDPNELITSGEFPLALNALSHYHRLTNPSAYIHSREGHLTRNIRPDEILRVVPQQDFFAQHVWVA